MGDASRFTDNEPARASLVVFEAWAPREGMPALCPSGLFMKVRFAVNCWPRKRRSGA